MLPTFIESKNASTSTGIADAVVSLNLIVVTLLLNVFVLVPISPSAKAAKVSHV